MPTKTVEVQQSQTYLQELLLLVSSGSEIILTQGDTPVARLVPITTSTATPRIAGLHLNAIQMSDDFDEPLSEDFWLGEA